MGVFSMLRNFLWNPISYIAPAHLDPAPQTLS